VKLIVVCISEFKMDLETVLYMKIPQFLTLMAAYGEIQEDMKKEIEKEQRKQSFFSKYGILG
jgi:hypothetical protein